MRTFVLVVLIGSALVLALNALGALLAQWFGFDAGNVYLLSILLYFAIGYFASRIMPVLHTFAALVLIALIEAGVGWLLAS